MKNKAFGNTGHNISQVSFGGGAISGEGGGYGFGNISESEAISLLQEALDKGINTFDTAPCYGLGSSEVRMGKAFKDRRDRVFLVSKSGVTWDENKRIRKTNDPDIAVRMLEQSLKDLQTDYIDLYMIHWPDDYFDIKETYSRLAEAKKQGKIKHLGLANTNKTDMEACHEISPLAAIQNQYNFFDESAKTQLAEHCRNWDLGFMGYGTLDKGILTGRVSPERKYDSVDVRHRADWWKKDDRRARYQFMDKLKPLCDEWGVSLLEFALYASLRNDMVSTALVGARNSEQLEGVISAVQNNPMNEGYFAKAAEVWSGISK